MGIPRMKGPSLRKCALGCLLSVVYILFLGLTELVLENPYTGCVLWLLVGTLVGIVNIQRREIAVCSYYTSKFVSDTSYGNLNA